MTSPLVISEVYLLTVEKKNYTRHCTEKRNSLVNHHTEEDIVTVLKLSLSLLMILEILVSLDMKMQILSCPTVRVNFICQLEWVMGCPDWALSPVVSVKVLPDEISIWISGLGSCSPSQGCRHPPVHEGPEKKKPQREEGSDDPFSPASSFDLGHLTFIFCPELDLKPSALLASGLWTWTKLDHWLSWVSAYRRQITGLLSLHNNKVTYTRVLPGGY